MTYGCLIHFRSAKENLLALRNPWDDPDTIIWTFIMLAVLNFFYLNSIELYELVKKSAAQDNKASYKSYGLALDGALQKLELRGNLNLSKFYEATAKVSLFYEVGKTFQQGELQISGRLQSDSDDLF